jgi:excinuclease ABC subunit C
VIGLAKKLEEIYFPEKNIPLKLPFSSPALKLLMRVRDEAHRFAIAYHRATRRIEK